MTAELRKAQWSQTNHLFRTGLTLSGPGFMGCLGRGGGGWRRVPTAHNSKAIHGIAMKFGSEVENHRLINLL